MKRKLILLFLALALSLSLCACGAVGNILDNNSPDEQKEFSMGKVDGSKYENSFTGIGCSLDSDWTFYTEEQIMQLNNIASDYYSEDAKSIIENANVVYDMFAADSNMTDNVSVNLEKVNSVQLAVLDISDTFENQMTMMKDTYNNMGYTDFSYDMTTVNIGGEEFSAVKISIGAEGVELHQLLFAKKCNGYLANFAITAASEGALYEILDCFYLVK